MPFVIGDETGDVNFMIVTKPCEVITNETGDVNFMFSQKLSSKGPL